MFHHEVSKRKSTNVRVKVFKKFNTALSRMAPGIAARLSARLFVTPIPSRRPSREIAWAEGAVQTTIPSPLGPIPLWVWGDGPAAVILAHGWSGRGLQLGAFIEPLMTQGFRVATYDAPGHGDTAGRTSSMPAFAAALGAVARRFDQVAAVIAHSLGATAAIYAFAHRELTADRFVAVSPAARLHAVRERFGEMTGFEPPVINRMRSIFEDRLGFDWEASEPLRMAPAMSMSLMVIHDSGDRFIPHSEGAELADAWPDGRLLSTTGLGHHRILRTREVIDSAVAFIGEPAEHPQLERKAS